MRTPVALLAHRYRSPPRPARMIGTVPYFISIEIQLPPPTISSTTKQDVMWQPIRKCSAARRRLVTRARRDRHYSEISLVAQSELQLNMIGHSFSLLMKDFVKRRHQPAFRLCPCRTLLRVSSDIARPTAPAILLVPQERHLVLPA